jgi:translation initiation factor 5B
MPPKKKNNKKAADDWEAELGETPPVADATTDIRDEPAEADAEEEFPAGGLMAMMRKRQKKKKGKQADEDIVEGEDPPAEEVPELAEKAPVEASIEDEFTLPDKKGKGKSKTADPAKEADEDDERGADGKVLTKAQKEKLKKEREKQRKKENVSSYQTVRALRCLTLLNLGCKEEDDCSSSKGT